MSGFGRTSAPVAICGVLGFLEASNSYKIDYIESAETGAATQTHAPPSFESSARMSTFQSTRPTRGMTFVAGVMGVSLLFQSTRPIPRRDQIEREKF
jgi:hypothetical protein